MIASSGVCVRVLVGDANLANDEKEREEDDASAQHKIKSSSGFALLLSVRVCCRLQLDRKLPPPVSACLCLPACSPACLSRSSYLQQAAASLSGWRNVLVVLCAVSLETNRMI